MPDWSNPTVAQQLLFATVRIETSDPAGKPLSVGTSFVVDHVFPCGRRELFLVSNKHVLEGAATGYLYLTRRGPTGSPELGNPFYLRVDDFALAWHGHPDANADVAVSPFGWQLDLIAKDGVRPYLMELSSQMIASEAQMAEFDSFEPVIFVGYPNGLYDEVNYTPIVRQATTATPLQFDFCGRPEFLIDGSVFPGSSGSPVYSYSRSIKGRIIDVRLLGVISSVFTQSDSGEIVVRPAPTNAVSVVAFEQIIDLGVVQKGRLVLEALADFGRKHDLMGKNRS